jgi:hypothetical protein
LPAMPLQRPPSHGADDGGADKRGADKAGADRAAEGAQGRCR